MADCVDEKKNLGVTKCNKLPALPRGIITTPDNFKLSAEDALDPDKWQDAIIASKSNRIYLWPFFVGFEDGSEESVYEVTPLADLVVRDGKYIFKPKIKKDLCTHKAMFTHRSNSGRVFIYDTENQLIGTQDADGNFMGFSIGLLNVEKMKFSDGTVSTKTPVHLVLANSKEFDENGAMIDADFVNSLNRLTDVKITILAAADDEVTLTVTNICDGTSVDGLAKEDFKFLGAGITPVVVSTATLSEGVYTLTQAGALFVTGTLNLVAAADLTIQAYESTGPVVVTIA